MLKHITSWQARGASEKGVDNAKSGICYILVRVHFKRASEFPFFLKKNDFLGSKILAFLFCSEELVVIGNW